MCERRGDKNLLLKKISQQFLAVLLAMLVATCTFANPVLENVASGNVTVQQSGNTTEVNQTSQQAIVNWQSFNINANEKTQFVQPNASSIALNRINPMQGASQIYGQLSANGQLILVNQAGIYFGPTAHVDAAGLIASTTDITNQNFLAGKYSFDQTSSYNGSVINAGEIDAANNGLVALLGSSVRNDGLIKAHLGSIVLGSGSKFTLDLSGDQLINFSVNAASNAAGVDQNDQAQTYGVKNTGALIANGGTILVSAQAAQSVLNNAIDMQGVAVAHSVSQHNGEIILSAGAEGQVNVSGRLDVSAKVGSGGTIKVLGNAVQLTSSAVLNAKGDTNGGTILIGGDAHGAGPDQNALITNIAQGANISANAGTNGNGGTIVVWSNDNTVAYGNFSATGGRVSGHGGYLETSGHVLDVSEINLDLRAPHGTMGTWLLDPYNLYVDGASTTASGTGTSGSPFTSGSTDSYLNASTLVNDLANANIALQTTNSGSIEVDSALSWSSATTLSLLSSGNIYLNAAINAPAGSLILSAANGAPSLTAGTIGSGTVGSAVTTEAYSVNVANFTLQAGQWLQASTSLPTFNVTNNFSIALGSTYNNTFHAQFTRVSTTSTPYGVIDVFGLQGIATDPLNTNYSLANNIDATSTVLWNSGAGFLPIGNTTTYFSGTFNGNNNVINKLYMYAPPGSPGAGFFGDISGTVENVGLLNENMTGYYMTSIGGLVGYVTSTGSIQNSYTTGVVNGPAAFNVGGLVGTLAGSISNSYSSANVYESQDLAVGGLVGWLDGGSITNSYATGSVTQTSPGSAKAGGLVGAFQNSGSITNSYSTGYVSGINNVGGLVGLYAGTGTLTNSYWDTQTSGQSTSAIGTGETTNWLETPTNYPVGWTFTAGSGNWYMAHVGTTYTLPILQMEIANPTNIVTAHGLQLIAMSLNGNYALGGNIDASGTTNASDVWTTTLMSGQGFIPIGNGSGAFTGSFNGKGDTINNLYINLPTTNDVGLFGAVNTVGTLQNIALTDATISGASYTGALIGYLTAGILTTSYSSGAVTGAASGSDVGGLVGYSNGIINNDYSLVTVSAGASSTNVGGLAGYLDTSATLNEVYSTGGVTGPSVGGLVGSNAVSGYTNVTHSFWNVTSSGIGSNGSTVNSAGGTGESTTNLMNSSTFSGWSIDSSTGSTWYIINGSVLPILQMEYNTTISNAHQLQLINLNLAATYMLDSNINLSSTSSATEVWGGLGFSPIGSNANPFTGTFNGRYNVINNLYINLPMTSYVGLFAAANSTSVISNIGLLGANITGGNYTGAVVGYTNGSVMNTYSDVTSSVTAGSSYQDIGGLIGELDTNGSVIMSYSGAAVSGGSDLGGLIGYANGTVTNAYSLGSVTSTSSNQNVGGLLGYVNGAVTNVYSSGLVTGNSATNVGGLIGNHAGGTITSSYWDISTSGIGTNGSTTNGVGTGSTTGLMGYNTINLLNASNYTSWNIGTTLGSTWYMTTTSGAGSLRPLLQMEIANPNNVVTAHGLQLMNITISGNDGQGGNYSLGGNINASGITNAADVWGTSLASGIGFTPIGNKTTSFTGNFNGNNYVINDLYINNVNNGYVGLFGYINNQYGTVYVHNVGLTNMNISGGGVTGGILGEVPNGGWLTINNVFTTGIVTGTRLSGSSDWAVGAIAADFFSNDAILMNSYSTATSQAGASAYGETLAGLVGYSGNGGSHSIIMDSFFAGDIKDLSGLSVIGGITNASGTVTNSYWDTQVSGASSSSGGTGETTSQLQTGLLTGFASQVWGIIGGSSYPYLLSFYPSTPRVISGTSPANTTHSDAAAKVSLVANGSLLDTDYTGANGAFYFLESSNAIANGSAFLTYLSSGSIKSNIVNSAPSNDGSLTGLSMTNNTLGIGSTAIESLSTNALASTYGNLNDPNILYSVSSGSLTLDSGINLVTTSNTTYTINGNITASGTGTLTFNGNIALGANSTLQTTASGSITIPTAISLGSYTLTINNADANSAIAGIISGTGNLTEAGSGTLTLSGTNTYSGNTTLSSGLLTLSNNSSLGTSTLNLNGGTFEVSSNGMMVTNNYNIGGSSTLGGSKNFTLSGNGTFDSGDTLSINNTGTTILSGMLNGSGNLSGSSSAGTITLSGAIGGTTALNSINLQGASTLSGGTLATSGTQTYGGAVTLDAATTLTTAQDLNFTTVNLNGNGLTLTELGTGTQAGNISGSGNLTVNGNGTLTFSQTNTYTGSTTIALGTLVINNNGNLNSTLGVTVASGGTLDFTFNNATLTNSTPLNINGGTVVFSGTNIILGNNMTLSNGSVLAGSGSANLTGAITATNLTKAGSGTITLSGSDSYSGLTSVNAGTLAIANTLGDNTAVANGATLNVDNVTLNNQAITLNGGTLMDTGNSTVNGSIVLNGDSTLNSAGNFTLNAAINGSHDLTTTGTGTMIFNNTIAVNSLTANSAVTLDNANITSANDQVFNNAVQITGSSNLDLLNSGNILFNGAVSGATHQLTVNSNGALTIGFAGNVALQQLNGTTAANTTLSFANDAVALQANLTNQTSGSIAGSNIALNYTGIGKLVGNDRFSNILQLPNKTNIIYVTGSDSGYVNDPFYFIGFNTFNGSSKDFALIEVPYSSGATSNAIMINGNPMYFNQIPFGSTLPPPPPPTPTPAPIPAIPAAPLITMSNTTLIITQKQTMPILSSGVQDFMDNLATSQIVNNNINTLVNQPITASTVASITFSSISNTSTNEK